MEKTYWLPPQIIRNNSLIMSMDPLTRGVYRDILDLMWLTKAQCSLPMKLDVIASRLNTDEKTLKKAVNKLTSSELGLFNIEKTPVGDYLVSEFLRLQKGGVEKPQELVKESSSVDEIQLDKTSDPYVYRRYIDAEEAFANAAYKGWMPTNRFIANGEAFVIAPPIVKEIEREVPEANLDYVFSRAYSWLMTERNAGKRPTYGGMLSFLIGFASRSVNVKPANFGGAEVKSTPISDADFEAEMMKLLGTEG